MYDLPDDVYIYLTFIVSSSTLSSNLVIPNSSIVLPRITSAKELAFSNPIDCPPVKFANEIKKALANLYLLISGSHPTE